MFEIGGSLREARLKRNLTPADVQKAIRIRERYLTALEEERWELLPGDAYVKGFLRTYAEYLGLDGQLYIEEYNSRLVYRDEAVVPDTISAPRSRRSGAFRLLSLLAIVGAVAALAAWQLGGGTHTPTKASALGAGNAAAAVPKAKPKAHPKVTQVSHSHAVFAVVTATRGRSWVMIRAGGETG